ncbi:MAG: GNAT family N-acetyltransferase [Oligosphaeraceae bacterium]|nr:GNAT family N-acetyltransferase [Oligosphaeraceae bacterium]
MTNNSYAVRVMQPGDRKAVAGLICLSTSVWYQSHLGTPRFLNGPQSTELYYDVYHALPGSSGVVAVDDYSGQVIGSCFQHIRPTHVSLGIMNVHPSYACRGIASALLKSIVGTAEALGKPVRLVSSALNLDSFSLYNRQGFLPYSLYQDMRFAVPAAGYPLELPAALRVRPARIEDLPAIQALETAVSGIARPGDWRHFIENPEGIWSVSVCESAAEGALTAVLGSVFHAATNMIGPGLARDCDSARAVLVAQLNQHRGRTPVALLPIAYPELVAAAYALGGRNTEIHFAQARGAVPALHGPTFPTFMPESF